MAQDKQAQKLTKAQQKAQAAAEKKAKEAEAKKEVVETAAPSLEVETPSVEQTEESVKVDEEIVPAPVAETEVVETMTDNPQTENTEVEAPVTEAEVSEPSQPEAAQPEAQQPEAPEQPQEPQVTVWNINDISSPSHERFSLKQGSKRVIELAPADIQKLGLGFNPEAFKNKNNFIEVTKHKLMVMVQEGKFNVEGVEFKWTAPADKFPNVQPIAPEKKTTATKADGTKATAPEQPFTANELNFFDDANKETVNF